MKRSIRNGVAVGVAIISIASAFTLWAGYGNPAYFIGDFLVGVAAGIFGWALSEAGS